MVGDQNIRVKLHHESRFQNKNEKRKKEKKRQNAKYIMKQDNYAIVPLLRPFSIVTLVVLQGTVDWPEARRDVHLCGTKLLPFIIKYLFIYSLRF